MAKSKKVKIGGLLLDWSAGRFVMLGAVILIGFIVAGYIFIGKNIKPQIQSNAKVDSVSPPTGGVVGGQGTPEYNKMLENKNNEQTNAALNSNNSYIATPIGNSQVVPYKLGPQEQLVDDTPAPKPDKAPAPAEQTKPVPMQYRAPTQQDRDGYDALLQQIGAAMTQVNETNSSDKTIQTRYNPVASNIQMAANETVMAAYEQAYHKSSVASAKVAMTPAAKEKDKAAKLVAESLKPGKILYAVFDIAINSDINGPVMGEIVQGPANGYKVFGIYSKLPYDNSMGIKFNKVVSPAGDSFPIEGYAIDPNTTEQALSGDTDYHALSRTGGILALSFIGALQGFGQAIAQNAQATTTTTTGVTSTISKNALTSAQIGGIAAGAAANAVAPALQPFVKDATRPNTIHIKRNQPFGLLVVSSS